MDPVFISAWIATLLFFVSRLRSLMEERCARLRKWLDHGGAVLLWIHILLAYVLTHQSSHAAAVEHVAERTEAMTGIRSGAGVYANFLVAAVWTITSTWDGSQPRGKPPAPWRIAAEVFLWLMFICASVVFALPVSAAVFSILIGIVIASWWFYKTDAAT